MDLVDGSNNQIFTLWLYWSGPLDMLVGCMRPLKQNEFDTSDLLT